APSKHLSRSLILLLKLRELGLQLPLHAGAFIGCEKGLACRRGLPDRRRVSRAGGRHAEDQFRIAPQALTWQKAVLETLARHALQIRIRKAIGLNPAQVFMRHVRTVYSLVVGSKRNWDAVLHINRKGMILSAHSEDQVLRGQRNFYKHIAIHHLMQ